MLFSNFSRMNPLDNTPKRKVTRFSEHPQIFEYSSKSKKENIDQDNDSLLLDNNLDVEPPTSEYPHHTDNLYPSNAIDFNKKQLELDQLTSELAQIEAYLNTQSEPIVPAPEQSPEPKRISFGLNDEKRPRLSFNVKSSPNDGRETMNVEQQTKIKSQLKSISPSIKKVVQKEGGQQKQKSDEDFKERLEEQIKKKNRITMDVNSLLNMINSYEREQCERNFRETRRNRVTLDVFALSKMVENMGQSGQNIKQTEEEGMVTPVKNGESLKNQSYRKNKIFSSFKNNSTCPEVAMQISQYLMEVTERISLKNKQASAMNDIVYNILSEETKTKIKIDSLKEEITHNQHYIKEKLQYKEKLIKILHQNSYEGALTNIRQVSERLGFEIIKYERHIEEDLIITIAHINIHGIFIKLKSKHTEEYQFNSRHRQRSTKQQNTDIKLVCSRESREYDQNFLFSVQENVKILKKYHYSYVSQTKNSGNLLQIASILKHAYNSLKVLDLELQYLSLNFQSQNFELTSSLDVLNFNIQWGTTFHVLVEIKILDYINDRTNVDSISVYDMQNHVYMDLKKQWKESQSKDESLLFTMMRGIINHFV